MVLADRRPIRKSTWIPYGWTCLAGIKVAAFQAYAAKLSSGDDAVTEKAPPRYNTWVKAYRALHPTTDELDMPMYAPKRLITRASHPSYRQSGPRGRVGSSRPPRRERPAKLSEAEKLSNTMAMATFRTGHAAITSLIQRGLKAEHGTPVGSMFGSPAVSASNDFTALFKDLETLEPLGTQGTSATRCAHCHSPLTHPQTHRHPRTRTTQLPAHRPTRPSAWRPQPPPTRPSMAPPSSRPLRRRPQTPRARPPPPPPPLPPRSRPPRATRRRR
ncbi:hypothetical protein FA95DRAFT_1561125 [Auriscalpium vulgare]|uniref:Uncharacterized protein n=1 Tax=Auriscalpium vulgare TaxID=40419 RepID=A0ACB8RMY3_9AGAM|nr:hypothetical protein FA95DRAFT_1561125 [Auriscalpium vulgare]